MSLHRVVAKDPASTAEAGWKRDFGGYWFAVYRGEEVVAHGGLNSDDEPDELRSLPTLHDLLNASWGVIAWEQSDRAVWKLRDDPWAEPTRAVPRGTVPAGDFLARTLGFVA